MDDPRSKIVWSFLILWITSVSSVDALLRKSFTSSLSARTFPRCPSEEELLPCICALKGSEVHVRCENSEMGKVGASLEVLKRREITVEELYLVANRIPSIPARFFGSLEIHKLFLLDNEMASVSRNAFAGLESSLKHFYIRESTLEEVPFDSFDNLKELRSLIIEDTSLTIIPRFYTLPLLEFVKIDLSRISEFTPDSFRTMPSMRKIQISKSNIKSLGENSLEGLIYLKEINFSGNNITWVHPGTFRNLEMVEELSLEGNKIVDATATVMATRELRSIKVFNLAHNKIRVLSRATFVDLPNLEIVNLSFNELELIDREAMYKLPNLKRLDLSNNKIYHFEINVFTDVSSLEYLILANNNLSLIEDLKFIYRNLPNLKTLDLSSNYIRGGSEYSLGGHSKLETLILNRNFITEIDKNLFRSLPNLRELHLSHNHIKRDTESRLWELPKLQVLDLSQNDITTIDGNFLSGLPKLSDLYLSFNLITDISTKVFYETNQLKSLNISNNKIKKLLPNTFRQISDLYELDISFNELGSLEEGLLDGLTSLEFLYVANNQIMGIHGRVFKDTAKLKYLELSHNLLDHIPSDSMSMLPSLQKLNLRRNAIGNIPRGSFSQLRIMETLDLSHNHIQSLDRLAFSDMNVLRNLDLSVNFIQILPANIFENMNLIEKLNISNNFISSIGQDALRNVKRLRILDLTNNSLTNLGQTIRDMTSLQGLFLNHNYINKLGNDSFINLPSLNVLFFNNNGLQTFEIGTFYNLSALMYLDLANNNLVEINSYSFASLKTLRELKLSHNQIASVKDYSFVNLPTLQSLELQDNVIILMGDQAFDKISSLKFLNLSRNGLQEIPEKSLSRVPTLDVLDLSYNYMVEIGDSNFRNLQWLTVLLLQNNDICFLSPNSFSGPRSLRVLMLQNNQLKRLHLSALQDPIQSLSLLDMGGNPFVCDCELIWLREYLQREQDRQVSRLRHVRNYFRGSDKHEYARNLLPVFPGPMHGQPICAGPPEYAGMMVTEVPPEAFFCNGGFRELSERREKCAPRFIDPQIFATGNPGNGLAPEVLNTLLKLSNLSEILPSDSDAQSYLDYNNPIVVSGLSELISNFSKQHSFGKGKIPALSQTILKAPVEDNNANLLKHPAINDAALSSDFVTGDTPTIYAGPSKLNQKGDDKDNEAGTATLFGFKLPGIPNILDTIGKFKLPNLGINVDWAGLPFGRVEDGAVPQINDAVRPFLHQFKPTRAPEDLDEMWVKVPQTGNQQLPLLSSIPEMIKNYTSGMKSGRGNGTNHGKLYETFLSHLGNKDKRVNPFNVEQAPIPFSEPYPEINLGNGNKGMQPYPQSQYHPPMVPMGPGPNSGTPFLPGLVNNNQPVPMPFVPNRNFYQNGQHKLGINNSDIRGIVPNAPKIKFPNDEESESWSWSPPEAAKPGTFVYPPDHSFQPMKPFHPMNVTSSGFPMISNRLPNHIGMPDILSTDGEGMQMNQVNKPSLDTVDTSSTIRSVEISTLNTLDTAATSTSQYDDWTRTFEDEKSQLQTTTQSNSVIKDNIEPSDPTNLEDMKFLDNTDNPLLATENYIPVSLLPNVHLLPLGESDSSSTSSTTQMPDSISTSTEPSISITSTQSVIEGQNSFTTLQYHYYDTSQRDDLYPQENFVSRDNRERNNSINGWWLPPSLGDGISLVPNDQIGLVESVQKGDTLINGLKHVSPSRSISFASGVPSVEKVESHMVKGVDLPPQHKETLLEEIKEELKEVDIITERPPEQSKQAGVMDWYYSNYNRVYDPEAPLPMGGNRPSNAAKLSHHTSLYFGSLLCYILANL